MRFEKKLPYYDHGSILFATTGMLLKKLTNNPDMEGVTHVIIDEVHERDVQTDLLLILLKRLIKKKPDLKVILMSASINAQKFAQYFDNAPILEFSGRCFDVDISYLEDVHKLLGVSEVESQRQLAKFGSNSMPSVDAKLIAELVSVIDRKSENNGSILVFLPGE